MGFPATGRGRRANQSTPPTPPSYGPMPTPEWPVQATDSIVRLVDQVRDATTGKAVTAARVLVYGSVVAILMTPLLVLGLIGTMRACEAVLENAFGLKDPMWIVYLTFGVVFVGAGLFCWGRAKKPRPA